MAKTKKSISNDILEKIINAAENKANTEIKKMALDKFMVNYRTQECIVDPETMHYFCHKCGREGIAEKGICECGKIMTDSAYYCETIAYEVRYEKFGFWICMYTSWNIKWIDALIPTISLCRMYASIIGPKGEKVNLSYDGEWNLANKNFYISAAKEYCVINESEIFEEFLNKNQIENYSDLFRMKTFKFGADSIENASIEGAMITDGKFKNIILNDVKENDIIRSAAVYTSKFITSGNMYILTCPKCKERITLMMIPYRANQHQCSVCGTDFSYTDDEHSYNPDKSIYSLSKKNIQGVYAYMSNNDLIILFRKFFYIITSENEEIVKLDTEYFYVKIESNGKTSLFDMYGKELSMLSTEKKYYRYWEYPIHCFLGDSKKIIDTYTGTKYTGFREYIANMDHNYLEYLSLYKEYPEVEMLSKFGLYSLVEYTLSKYDGTRKSIPAKLRPKNGLRLNKSIIKGLQQIDSSQMEMAFNIIDASIRDANLNVDELIPLIPYYRNVQRILTLKIPGMNVHEIKKYIDYVDDFQCCPPNESVQLWADYLRMTKENEGDLTDRRVIFTNSLKREHDKASRRAKIVKDEKILESFEKIVNDHSYMDLAFEGTEYNVKIPVNPNDLHEEGRKLNHCVGSYVRMVANGSCKILFVRDKNDKSICTLEVVDNKIVQARGFSNAYPSNRIIEFLKKRYAPEKKLELKL